MRYEKAKPELSDIVSIALRTALAAIVGGAIGFLGLHIADYLVDLSNVTTGDPQFTRLLIMVTATSSLVFAAIGGMVGYYRRRKHKTCPHCGEPWSVRATALVETRTSLPEIERFTDTEVRVGNSRYDRSHSQISETREIQREITWQYETTVRNRKCLFCGADADLVKTKKRKVDERVVHTTPWRRY
ncbi:MAG: hypothetical protein HUJ27_14685 [Rhodobacteraceae bacterium]|nr:hypothetical protein [Paracoccaceae bacterium]